MTNGALSFDRSSIRRRRLVAGSGVLAVVLILAVFGGHRGAHAVRNVVLPGAGLFETMWWLGAALAIASVIASVLWVRWGMDWTVVAVLVVSVLVSLAVSPTEHRVAASQTNVVAAGHEFPILILLFAGWQSVRGLPVLNRLLRRTRRHLDGLDDIAKLAPVDRCRAVSILSLAGPVAPAIAATVDRADVIDRARRIALAARGRRGDRVLARDHAALRTARVAIGHAGSDLAELGAEAGRQRLGVIASEPGWIRLVDATLAAAVLQQAGDATAAATWEATLDAEFGLRRGHRNGAYWTPLGFSFGRAADWEHATATAVARTCGMIGPADWQTLRARFLGAAARGSQRRADERMIAAGRLWLTTVDDPAAARILARPTIRRDPLACAIDAFATSRRPASTVRGRPKRP